MKNKAVFCGQKILSGVLSLLFLFSPGSLAYAQTLPSNAASGVQTASPLTQANNSSSAVFVENKGQLDEDIYFSTIDSSIKYDFKNNSIVENLPKSTQTIKVNFVNPDHYVIPHSDKSTGGQASYYRGNNQADWTENAKMYSQVTYSNVWDGIDVVYQIDGSNIKYSFVVSPNADASKIKLTFEGTSSITSSNNQLILDTPAGKITEQDLKVYQNQNNQETPVTASFNIEGNQVSFNLGNYDHSKTLIVDPTLVYSSYLGYSKEDIAYGTASDSDGNMYAIGTFISTAPGAGATDKGTFIKKMSPTAGLIYYKEIIGAAPHVNSTIGYSIAVDSAKNVYFGGTTNTDKLPVLTGPMLTQSTPLANDYFAGKYDSNGNLVYLGYVDDGVATNALGRAVAVDNTGSLYITGHEVTAAAPSNFNIRTYKINPSGTGITYDFVFGGSANEEPRGIAVDSLGNAYVVGYTKSAGLATVGAFDTTLDTLGGGQDGFYAKINANGNQIVYLSYIGGDGTDVANGIALDQTGTYMYITGEAGLATNFTRPAGDANFTYTTPGFLVKVKTLDGFLLATRFVAKYQTGGAGNAVPKAVATDSNGNIYVTGGANTFPGYPAGNQTAKGHLGVGGLGAGYDVFVQKLDPNFNILYSALPIGGSDTDDIGYGIAVNKTSSSTITIVGSTVSSDMQVVSDTQPAVGPQGGQDAFIARMSTKADNVGVFRPSNGLIYQKFQNYGTGFADNQIVFGVPGDKPISGDWDGDGIATIGVFRNGVFYLRNTNTTGFADIVATMPNTLPTDLPVAGDWNGDGTDTIGLFRPGSATFILSNNNSTPTADYVASLGVPGDLPIIGDWNGDGTDTIGVFRPSNGQIYLRNTNTTGFADVDMVYGIAGDQPLSGDWDGDGTDTIGVLRGNTFLLRNSNSTGNADINFVLGNPGDIPLAGNWIGIY